MDIGTASVLIVLALIGLMLIGLPLAFVTGAVAIGTTLLVLGPQGLPLVASRVYSFVMEYALVAVPMFILMASLLERSGVARDLYNAMSKWAGGLPGGVAVQTTIVAVLIAAVTGIIGGEVVMLGLMALPQMLRLGYDKRLASGVICAGGSLGTMIPPSIVLIFYGLTAAQPIGDLFVAAAVPGLMLASLYVAYVLIRCRINPELGPPLPVEERATTAEKLRLLRGLLAPMAIAVWVLGSIYGGIASVSEAAGVGVAGTLAVAAMRGELNWRMLNEALQETLVTCGKLLWITFGATALIGIYNVMGGTRFLQDFMAGLPLAPIAIVLVMMAILIVLGMFMDWIGILLLTMPVFVPVITDLGFDPIWFGVLFTMNMQISYLTPPFGPACFFLKSVAPPELQLPDIFRGMLPFIGLQGFAIILVIIWPEIALWLPSVLR
ncbi:MAG: TRAP transporter large permease subunit [Azospirillaceae bacterium]